MSTITTDNKPASQDPDDRPFNDPNIGPIAFLEACMHCETLSYALRLKAARYLAMIAAGSPQPSATIHLRDPVCWDYVRRFPNLLKPHGHA
jgi:hypothetical protein